MANTKPFVSLACICERALQDKDGVFSLIRVIDTAYVDMTLPPEAPKNARPGLEYTLVVAMKSGELKGSFQKLRLMVRKVDNADPQPIGDGKPMTTDFQGGAHGYYIKVDLRLAVDKVGLMWFDVMWGDEVLTSIPLHIKEISEAPKA